ncbi:hypothetical protein [Paenibacillus qinlingensis]|uniref:Uncharacterized protein n=1 Tax=Paenibacillus qinlingensis TaxID=1837343 RepID=A0ABU1NU54_9BACL|nr:hypothetical protein [Paenibacillus qinlingensis]MDR6550517.1 hypothetical protein [Paenibacillus qinlingensis]
MAYTRLIVVVMVFEVLISALVGLGLYWGFSVFPYSPSTVSTTAAMGNVGFNATIPLYMPSLKDLKIPYTYLQAGTNVWGITAILVSLAVMGLQSFVRGMYLGGLKGWVLNRKVVPLFACGCRYFSDMIAWSLFQGVISVLTLVLAAVFFPLGLVLIITIMLYSLTPYLIVLQDIPFHEAIGKAPRLFRRYFTSMLPLALFTMLCTLVISSLQTWAAPWGFVVPLIAYSFIGTWLIGSFMSHLSVKLSLDRRPASELLSDEVRTRRIVNILVVLLVPVLLATGSLTAVGKHLSAFDWGSKERLEGVAYSNTFSDVFHASQQQYTAYEWQNNGYHMEIKLPDLSKSKPDELRGIADITWQINEEVRIKNGNSVYETAQSVVKKSRLMYRLVRETAADGSNYYSSLHGFSTILPGEARPRDPLSVQIMVSENGKHVFVLQYPTRFDVSKVFRVSKDGKYLIPATSQVNPMDFHAYWLTADQRVENLFELLAAKNEFNIIGTMNRAYLMLACALQEGDGHMVNMVLGTMRRSGIIVKAPDWNDETWTDNLRNRYQGADVQKSLELLSKAGIQGGYESKKLSEQSNEKIRAQRLEVPFPNSIVPITFEENIADGKLLSIQVFEEGS